MSEELIHVPYGNYERFTLLEVAAERVTIEDFGEFFVHHKLDLAEQDHINTDLYEVTEAETKCAVPNSVAASKACAIERAKKFLMERGFKEFSQAKDKAKILLAGLTEKEPSDALL